jgi:hypothetical protein
LAETVYVRVERGHLVATNAADAELLDGLEGEVFKAVLTQPKGRSVPQLNLYWKMCTLIAENLESDPPISKEMIDYVIKIEAGHCFAIRMNDGTYRLFPKSIAFNRLTPERFSKFMDRAFNVAAIKFGPALVEAVRLKLYKLMDGPT